jgi:hypothetical protein
VHAPGNGTNVSLNRDYAQAVLRYKMVESKG